MTSRRSHFTSRRRLIGVATAGLVAVSVCAPIAHAEDAWDTLPSIRTEAHQDVEDASMTPIIEKWVAAQPADTRVVVTPGTDDGGLYPRISGLVVNTDHKIVKYDESFGPIIAGKVSNQLLAPLPVFAPSYSESVAGAVDANYDVMEALQGYDKVVVYTGYSQGAEALGNAAEKANADGLLGGNTLILLLSDPRSPWGVKAWAKDIPGATPLLGLLGIDNDGARDPAKTDGVQVVSVIVKGDPAADFQWVWYRPVSSLLVDAAGFIAIHSAADGEYSKLDESNLVAVYQSDEGNTRYEIYDTYHPLALLTKMIVESVGIDVSDEQLQEWDHYADEFYPLQVLTPSNAAVAVHEVSLDPLADADKVNTLTADSDTDTTTETVQTQSLVVPQVQAPQVQAPQVQAKPASPKLKLATEPTPEAQVDIVPETSNDATTQEATQQTTPETPQAPTQLETVQAPALESADS